MGQQTAEPAHQAEQRPELQHQQHQHQPKTAENGVDEPFLAFAEQADTAVLKDPDLASHGVLQCFFWHFDRPFLGMCLRMTLQALSK